MTLTADLPESSTDWSPPLRPCPLQESDRQDRPERVRGFRVREPSADVAGGLRLAAAGGRRSSTATGADPSRRKSHARERRRRPRVLAFYTAARIVYLGRLILT